MKNVTLVLRMVVAVTVLILSNQAIANDKDLIPPEILKKMDPDILSGKRPTIGYIRQGDIFGLRDHPKFKEDFVSFDFDPGKISSPQKKIVQDWVAAGYNKVYLKDDKIRLYAPILGCTWSYGVNTKNTTHSGKMLRHPVNTDCHSLKFTTLKMVRYGSWDYCQVSISTFPGNAITIVEGEKGEALCGLFSSGKGTVYFRFTTHGTDARRFDLNWWHWAMGLQVPGAANTKVSGGNLRGLALSEMKKYDTVMLKNGDTVTGLIENKVFTIKASYGALTFELDKIDLIEFEGSGNNLEMIRLKIGDKVSGVIKETSIKVKLVSGASIEIDKDKIKKIQVKEAKVP